MDISKLLDPVSLEHPAGGDVRYDPLFELLQSEVDKLSSYAAATIDWERVVDVASDILAQKSKDLLVASYLAVGLLHTRGCDGLILGVELYLSLVETFWEGLHPALRKARARALAVEWWLEKTVQALQQGKVHLMPAHSLLALELLEKIERLLCQHLSPPPSFTALRECLQQMRQEVPANAVEEAPAVVGPDVSAGEPEEAPEDRGTAAAQALPDAAKEMDAALQRVREAAELLRQEDPSNPLAYRLLRTTLWHAIPALPPAVDGCTRIAPPEKRLLAALQELRQEGPEMLLHAAETHLTRHIFWLDLNRWSFEALGALGEPYRQARETVLQETLHLLERLPGVDALAYGDGMPFADAATRAWLRKAAASPSVPLQVTTLQSGASGEREGAISKATEEARLLLSAGKLPQALDSLHQRLQSCRSGKEKLLWRLALVQLLLNGSACRLALPQLDQILTELDRHDLDHYDPELAVNALKLAYLGFVSQDDPALREKAVHALFRIGRLDPAEMVRLDQA